MIKATWFSTATVNTLKLINKLGTSLTTEGRFVLRASLQINTYTCT